MSASKIHGCIDINASIHIEVTPEQLHTLRRSTARSKRVLLVIDSDAIAISNHHSEAWLQARQLACANWTEK